MRSRSRRSVQVYTEVSHVTMVLDLHHGGRVGFLNEPSVPLA